jgi:hypothetical protein
MESNRGNGNGITMSFFEEALGSVELAEDQKRILVKRKNNESTTLQEYRILAQCFNTASTFLDTHYEITDKGYRKLDGTHEIPLERWEVYKRGLEPIAKRYSQQPAPEPERHQYEPQTTSNTANAA